MSCGLGGLGCPGPSLGWGGRQLSLFKMPVISLSSSLPSPPLFTRCPCGREPTALAGDELSLNLSFLSAVISVRSTLEQGRGWGADHREVRNPCGAQVSPATPVPSCGLKPRLTPGPVALSSAAALAGPSVSLSPISSPAQRGCQSFLWKAEGVVLSSSDRNQSRLPSRPLRPDPPCAPGALCFFPHPGSSLPLRVVTF